MCGRSTTSKQRVGFQGLQVAFLLDTAWQTALTTGALTHMDYEMVSRPSAIYTLQKRLYDYNSLIGATFLQFFADENIPTLVLSMNASQTDIVLIERELLKEYDAALEHLRSIGSIPVQ